MGRTCGTYIYRVRAHVVVLSLTLLSRFCTFARGACANMRPSPSARAKRGKFANAPPAHSTGDFRSGCFELSACASSPTRRISSVSRVWQPCSREYIVFCIFFSYDDVSSCHTLNVTHCVCVCDLSRKPKKK